MGKKSKKSNKKNKAILKRLNNAKGAVDDFAAETDYTILGSEFEKKGKEGSEYYAYGTDEITGRNVFFGVSIDRKGYIDEFFFRDLWVTPSPGDDITVEVELSSPEDFLKAAYPLFKEMPVITSDTAQAFASSVDALAGVKPGETSTTITIPFPDEGFEFFA